MPRGLQSRLLPPVPHGGTTARRVMRGWLRRSGMWLCRACRRCLRPLPGGVLFRQPGGRAACMAGRGTWAAGGERNGRALTAVEQAPRLRLLRCACDVTGPSPAGCMMAISHDVRTWCRTPARCAVAAPGARHDAETAAAAVAVAVLPGRGAAVQPPQSGHAGAGGDSIRDGVMLGSPTHRDAWADAMPRRWHCACESLSLWAVLVRFRFTFNLGLFDACEWPTGSAA